MSLVGSPFSIQMYCCCCCPLSASSAYERRIPKRAGSSLLGGDITKNERKNERTNDRGREGERERESERGRQRERALCRLNPNSISAKMAAAERASERRGAFCRHKAISLRTISPSRSSLSLSPLSLLHRISRMQRSTSFIEPYIRLFK